MTQQQEAVQELPSSAPSPFAQHTQRASCYCNLLAAGRRGLGGERPGAACVSRMGKGQGGLSTQGRWPLAVLAHKQWDTVFWVGSPKWVQLDYEFPFLSYNLNEPVSPSSRCRLGISHELGQSPQPRISALSEPASFHSVQSGKWRPCEGAHGQPVPSSRHCSLSVKWSIMLGRAGCPHTLQGSPNRGTNSTPGT